MRSVSVTLTEEYPAKFVSIMFDLIQILKCFFKHSLLSQPNNNHNPNNKTTIIVVGLRQSNHWEHHHPPETQNFMIEQK